MPTILEHDESEGASRIREALAKAGDAGLTLVEENIDQADERDNDIQKANLHSFSSPETGEARWLLEAEAFFPPDTILHRSWVLDARPTSAEAIRIIAEDLQAGDTA